MTRFHYYAHADRRPRGDWPALRILVWLLLTGALAFWAVAGWFVIDR
jgi:hypothetical protein